MLDDQERPKGKGCKYSTIFLAIMALSRSMWFLTGYFIFLFIGKLTGLWILVSLRSFLLSFTANMELGFLVELLKLSYIRRRYRSFNTANPQNVV